MRNTFARRMIALAAAVTICVLPVVPATARAQDQDRPMTMEPGAADSDGVPLTLREALGLALDSNLNIAVRRYDPRVSENRVLFQQGVFDPSVSLFAQHRATTSPTADALQGAATRKDNTRFAQVVFSDPTSIGGTVNITLNASRFATNSSFFAINPSFTSNLTLTYDQSLLRNFGYDVNTTGIRVARRNVTISESQFRQAVIDTIQGVEKAYWDLKFALEDLAVKRHSMLLSQETLSQNRIRVDVGTMAPIDVTTAEAEVASRSQDVLVAENTLENARDALLLYLNQPETSPLWVLPVNPVDELPFDPDTTIDVNEAIAEAFAHRPDLQQTDLLLANDEDLVTQTKDGMRYDLVARAQYGRTGLSGRSPSFLLPDPIDPINNPPILVPSRDQDVLDAIGDDFDENFTNWLVSLNFVIPIGNKQAKSAFLEARLLQEQRRKFLASQKLTAVISVRNSARAVLNTVERIKASRVNVRLQRERLAAENKRYENGMTTTFDLFQFQDDLTRAESQVILAMVDYNKALADLEAAKGTLAEARGVRVADLVAQGAEIEEMAR